MLTLTVQSTSNRTLVSAVASGANSTSVLPEYHARALISPTAPTKRWPTGGIKFVSKETFHQIRSIAFGSPLIYIFICLHTASKLRRSFDGPVRRQLRLDLSGR